MHTPDSDGAVDAATLISVCAERSFQGGATPGRLWLRRQRRELPERYHALSVPPSQSRHWALRWKRVSFCNLPGI